MQFQLFQHQEKISLSRFILSRDKEEWELAHIHSTSPELHKHVFSVHSYKSLLTNGCVSPSPSIKYLKCSVNNTSLALSSVSNCAQGYFNTITQWCMGNHLCINLSKAKVIMFTHTPHLKTHHHHRQPDRWERRRLYLISSYRKGKLEGLLVLLTATSQPRHGTINPSVRFQMHFQHALCHQL